MLLRELLKLTVGTGEWRVFTLAASMKDDDQREGGLAVVGGRDVKPVGTGLARFGEIVLDVHLAGERFWFGAVDLRERRDYTCKENRSENGGVEELHGTNIHGN